MLRKINYKVTNPLGVYQMYRNTLLIKQRPKIQNFLKSDLDFKQHLYILHLGSWVVSARSLWVYLQVRSESWEGFLYSLRSHTSLSSQPLNRAVQYLRRLSQDPPSSSQSVYHSVSLIRVFIQFTCYVKCSFYC